VDAASRPKSFVLRVYLPLLFAAALLRGQHGGRLQDDCTVKPQVRGLMSGISSQLLDVDLAWVLLLDLGITRITLLALTCFLFKHSEKDSCVWAGSAVDPW